MKLITRLKLVKEDLTRAKARKRVRRHPTAEVLMWAENCLSDVGRSLSYYRTDGTVDALHEAERALLSLHGVVDELRARADRGA